LVDIGKIPEKHLARTFGRVVFVSILDQTLDNGHQLLWDTSKGKLMENEKIPDALVATNRSPDGRWFAFPMDFDVGLADMDYTKFPDQDPRVGKPTALPNRRRDLKLWPARLYGKKKSGVNVFVL